MLYPARNYSIDVMELQSTEELIQLKYLLDKALSNMDQEKYN